MGIGFAAERLGVLAGPWSLARPAGRQAGISSQRPGST